MECLFLVAGEASADQHGRAIVQKLRERYPNLRVIGIGGPALKSEGMECLVDANQVDIVGISEVISRLPTLMSGYARLKKAIATEKIDRALLIDLPDLNLMLAKHLKRAGIPVSYFVSPQVWVWRKYRIHKIKKRIDEMLVLFPFEVEFYREHGISCQFVGHPLVEQIHDRAVERERNDRLSFPRIAIIPGSRRTEIEHHRELLREAVEQLRTRYPGATFFCPVAATVDQTLLKTTFAGLPVAFSREGLQKVVARCDVSLTASGTATLETALVGTPQVMFYRLSAATAWIFRLVSRYRTHFSLPNIVLGRRLIPEFVQHFAVPESICGAVGRLLESDECRNVQLDGYTEIRRRLGTGGCSERVARAVDLVPLAAVEGASSVPQPVA